MAAVIHRLLASAREPTSRGTPMSNTSQISAASLTAISADLLHAVTGGANATLPNGEPNALLTGGPAPVVPPQLPPIDQTDAMARWNAEQRVREWPKNAQMWLNIINSRWLDIGRR